MNFQPLIDNLPMILAALGLLLWAAARFVDSRAKADPAIDKWDVWAPRLQWASQLYSEAIDWLVGAKVLSLKGSEKLEYLNSLVKTFEASIESGDYKGAITQVIGFWVDARGKSMGSISANPSDVPEELRDSPAQPE